MLMIKNSTARGASLASERQAFASAAALLRTFQAAWGGEAPRT